MKRVEMALVQIDKILMKISTISVFMILLIVTLDSIGRYAIRYPIYWSIDVIQMYLMVIALFFSLSYSFRHEDHIRMVSVRSFFNGKFIAFSDFIIYMVSATIFSYLAYRMLGKSFGHWTKTDYIIGAYLWPSWIPPFLVGVGCVMFTMTLVARAFVRLADIRTGAPDKLVTSAAAEEGL